MSFLRPQVWLAATLISVLTGSLSCTSTAVPRGQLESQPGWAAALTQVLPSPRELRGSSVVEPEGCDGECFEQLLLPPNRVTAEIGAAAFDPDWDPAAGGPLSGLAWAMYAVNFAEAAGPQEVTPAWQTPPGSELGWIGLGNHVKGTWEWYAEDGCSVADMGPYLNAYGSMYVLVIVAGLDPARLTRLEFHLPPLAVLATTPDPAEGDPPLLVDFDASASTGGSGAITGFEWDWTGDGIYEEDTGLTATADHTYAVPVECLARVRVTNDLGLSRRASARVAVRGVAIVNPAPSGPGEHAEDVSLCMVDGRPAIAYYERDINHLCYIRALDPYGAAWGPVQVVDDSAEAGSHPSLNIVDGYPAIAYGDLTSYALHYVRALDAQGAAWGEPMIVDATEGSGLYADLEIVVGRPAIGYHNYLGFDLRYVRALDAQGTAWGAPVIVDNDGLQGEYLSMEVVDGQPAISYWEKLPQDLCFVRATDADGTAWGVPLTLDGPDNVGADTSLAISLDRPVVTYFDLTHNDLKAVSSFAVDGSDWGPAITVDDVDMRGEYSSLAVVAGTLCVCYRDYFGDLLFRRATKNDGTSWAAEDLLLDYTGSPFATETSMVDVTGRPGIALAFEQKLTYVRVIE